jgi:lipopolysaccharide biosynthesis protein
VDKVRLLAFYLPQFHPIPENDSWWGQGFTEWTNTSTSKPLFSGHYQPHIPADLGYYDLRDHHILEKQAEMAQEYGVHGFVFYHYWFSGKRLLDLPVKNMLVLKTPDIPFCLCWSNENWTRRWDGLDQEILIEQKYSTDDDVSHIRNLIPVFEDKRYFRIKGRPVFIVYRAEQLPNQKKTAEIWRSEVAKAGLGELYLVQVESFISDIDPADNGFDAAVEFAPDWRRIGTPLYHDPKKEILDKNDDLTATYLKNRVYLYDDVVQNMLEKPEPNYKRFPGVFPGWDNSPRRQKTEIATIIHGSTPDKYQNYLKKIITRVCMHLQGEERLVFINAWNEWGEGCHLEPDRRFGHAYLKATRNVLDDIGSINIP